MWWFSRIRDGLHRAANLTGTVPQTGISHVEQDPRVDLCASTCVYEGGLDLDDPTRGGGDVRGIEGRKKH